MFGYMNPSMDSLSEQEKDRYQQVYCGLCHTMGTQLGQRTRLTLSHDMTFIALLLMSLYEPSEELSHTGCPVHPLEKRTWSTNECIAYAADLNVILMYHKCLDDWNDDQDRKMHVAANLLRGAYEQAAQRWPRQCAAMEQGLARISQIEKDNDHDPDAAGNVFGMIMGELLVMRQDRWEDTLRAFGQQLGRFIYQMDAACDLQEDRQNGSYNPFINTELTEEDIYALLMGYMGHVTHYFERLPLVQDIHVLRSVLYAGVWAKYNDAKTKAGAAA